MSKNILLLFLTINFLLLSSCGSSKPSSSRSTEAPDSKQLYTTKKLPKFYSDPPTSPDYYYGVGMAKKSNPQLAEDVARGRASDAVAAEIEVKISSVLRDFMEESGIDGNSRALEFNDVVRQKVVNEVMQSCKVKDRELVQDGNRAMVYVLMYIPLQNVKSAAKKAAREDEAMFNEFKANKGFDRLNQMFDSINTN